MAWKMQYHEELRFDFRHKAMDYRDAHGLAWSHTVWWDGRGFRISPISDRMNAWQRSHYAI